MCEVYIPIIPWLSLSVGRSHLKWRFSTLLALCITSVSLGCARHSATPAAPPRASERGLTSFQFVTETVEGYWGEKELQPPLPIGELMLPDYPEGAAAAGTEAMVVLRFVIDTEGAVTNISDSPVADPYLGPFRDEFRAAAESAIRKWRFQPAELQESKAGKDLNGDGKPDYLVLLSSKPVSVYLDVRFDFKMQGGTGHVKFPNTLGLVQEELHRIGGERDGMRWKYF